MTVHQQLEDMLRELLNSDDIVLRDDTAPEDIPGWDSLVHVNLMFGLEERFGLRVDGSRIFNFRRIGDLKSYIEERLPSSQISGPRCG